MKKHGIVRTALTSITAAQLLGPSNQRCAILFSPPTGTGVYTVTTDPGLSALGNGLNLLTTTPAILIDRETFGDAVQRAWYVISNGSPSLTIGFIETVEE